MATVTFRDETATGKSVTEFEVAGLPEHLTVRELIRLRVREEVARHNDRPGDRFNGLVRPDDAEAELNGYRLRESRRIDWERQAEIAERAFLSNGFFVLAGGARSRTSTKSWISPPIRAWSSSSSSPSSAVERPGAETGRSNPHPSVTTDTLDSLRTDSRRLSLAEQLETRHGGMGGGRPCDR